MLFYPFSNFCYKKSMYIDINSIDRQFLEQLQGDTHPESPVKVPTGCLRSSARTIMTTDLMEYHQPCQVNHTTPSSVMASYGPS